MIGDRGLPTIPFHPMADPDALIDLPDGDGIRDISFPDTEHYLVTRGFLANPQRSLSVLLGGEPQP